MEQVKKNCSCYYFFAVDLTNYFQWYDNILDFAHLLLWIFPFSFIYIFGNREVNGFLVLKTKALVLLIGNAGR